MHVKKMLRVGIFVDASNTGICAYKTFNRRVDYEKLLQFALGENYLYKATVYAVKFGDKMENWCIALKAIGYKVRVKSHTVFADGTKKADWDVGLVMDAVRMIDNIDILVIVSGDGDFLPLCQWAHDRGKIVHVIAVDDSTNRELKNIESGPVDEFKPINETLLLPEKPREEEKPEGGFTPRTEITNIQPAKFDNITPEERAKLDAAIAAHESAV